MLFMLPGIKQMVMPQRHSHFYFLVYLNVILSVSMAKKVLP